MGVDLWVKRVNEVLVAGYRDIVWKIFLRILHETPQYTGKAVANWNIGVGVPDYNFDPSFGDAPELVDDPTPGTPWDHPMGRSFLVPAHDKGDRKWIEKAKARNRPKLPLIKRDTRVYFNNAVRGDNDKGATTSTLYMEELQDPAYWAIKLRAVNRPYETAQESMIVVFELESRLRGSAFRPGGSNFQDYV